MIVDALERAGVAYMITGSVASSFHGAPRATRDLDVVIEPGPDGVDRLVDALQQGGLSVDLEAARRAVKERRQFNAIDSRSGWKVDFLVRKDRPFSMAEFERREPAELVGTTARIASAEDMIIAKLEWAAASDSERQRQDVAAMVEVAGPMLDRAYIERWIDELGLKDAWARVNRDLETG